MSANDQIILKQLIEETKAEIAANLSNSKFFELFVSEQVLKDLNLAADEIESGIVGDGGDGGIDAIYPLINGKLIVEDTDLSLYKKDINLELHIVQAKTSNSFSEDVLDKFIMTTGDLLNLEQPLENLKTVFNTDLIRVAGFFRNAALTLATKLPKLSISYYYGSFGTTQDIHPNVKRKEDKLKNTVMNYFEDCEFKFHFLGAKELLKMARTKPTTMLELNLKESVISTNDGGYIGLVSLKEYFKFISFENGKKREHIFDSNVRDYQGLVEVNQGIKETLQKNTTEDFWWLNNGVTILATTGTYASKKLILEDPQIVNGLQTSEEIYAFFTENPRIVSDLRSILVKIIVTDNSSSRDRVIRATNSQTSIPIASLKASDEVQRNIEDFFKARNLYYDRRKNYYKNHGFPRDKIISIPYLAQSVVAVLLKQPDNSKARPSTLLKKEEEYKKIFSNDYPIEMYFICVSLIRRVEAFLKASSASLASEDQISFRFHVALYLTLLKIGKKDFTPKDIVHCIQIDTLTDDFLSECTTQVLMVFNQISKSTGYSMDRIVKGKELVEELLSKFQRDVNLSNSAN